VILLFADPQAVSIGRDVQQIGAHRVHRRCYLLFRPFTDRPFTDRHTDAYQ